MRRSVGFDDIWPQVTEIVADVRDRGDEAVADWARRLGDTAPVRVPVEPQRLEADVERALRSLVDTVTAVHAAERPHDLTVEPRPGVVVERRWLPLESVGVYVPSGHFPLPSSLIMAAAPARAAGVRRICVVTPRPVPATIAAAELLGLDELYAVGGAQAIAALAFGTETIAPVDKIVGPGNRWVTAAKVLVSAHVGVDLPAGPSEVVVIADDAADPALCLADLRAQAEHGPDSEAVLVTPSRALADAAAWERTVVVDSLEDAVEWANDFAPEHLELHVGDPGSLVPLIRNAGAVFLGPETSAVIGDYYAGSNHVLPTGGLARSVGGLGLEAFLKPVEFVRVTQQAARVAAEVAGPLARVEGLTAHGEALAAR